MENKIEELPVIFSFTLNRVEDFAKFMDSLAEYRLEAITNMSCYLDLKTCLEELLMNIFQHGGFESSNKQPEVFVRLLKGEGEIVAEIVDNATHFNLLTSSHVADTSSSLEERAIGGLGIHLVKKLSDRLEYVPVENGNKVVLSKSTGEVTRTAAST